MLSLVSSRETPSRLNLPCAVLAAVVAAPPVVSAIAAMTSSNDAPSLIIWRSSGDNLPKAARLPPYALAKASVTVANGLPVEAAMSIAAVASFCASVTDPVALTNLESTGRNSSSVTPNNLPWVLIQASFA